jgi:hypothetical protein
MVTIVDCLLSANTSTTLRCSSMQLQDRDDTLYPDIPEAPDVYGSPLGLDFSALEGLIPVISFSAIIGFLTILWNIYALLAYIASIVFLITYVYATIRWNEYLAIMDKQNRDEEALYDEFYRGVKGSSRLDEVFAHIASDHPNDWKLAIIEADIILDSVLKEKGYAGASLGERLRSITPSQLTTIDDAWEAHKVRNQIAHEGADFVLTKRIAEETINRYRRVFAEFGIT